jgi:hypothetical protein
LGVIRPTNTPLYYGIKVILIEPGVINLQYIGFTVEKILDCGPSHIAEILGIDDYIKQLIYHETKKLEI